MTTRRGFLRMFAAAPIAGVAVGMAAKAEAAPAKAKCYTCACRPLSVDGGNYRTMTAVKCCECGVAYAVPAFTSFNGGHTHTLTLSGAHTHMICNCPGQEHNHGCPVHMTGLYRAV